MGTRWNIVLAYFLRSFDYIDTELASVPGRFFFNRTKLKNSRRPSVQLETDRPGVEANTEYVCGVGGSGTSKVGDHDEAGGFAHGDGEDRELPNLLMLI